MYELLLLYRRVLVSDLSHAAAKQADMSYHPVSCISDVSEGAFKSRGSRGSVRVLWPKDTGHMKLRVSVSDAIRRAIASKIRRRVVR